MAEKELDLLANAGDGNIEDMYLTFEVANETYAVSISCVTEIVGMQHISRIPDVPDYIKGAINLRGKVIPVMDQRLRFGLDERPYGDRTTIIVLDLEGVPTGLVVDHVTDVLSIPKEKIDPPPQWLGGKEQGLICGLGKMQNRVSLILDAPRLLTEKQKQELAPTGAEMAETDRPMASPSPAGDGGGGAHAPI